MPPSWRHPERDAGFQPASGAPLVSEKVDVHSGGESPSARHARLDEEAGAAMEDLTDDALGHNEHPFGVYIVQLREEAFDLGKVVALLGVDDEFEVGRGRRR